MQTRNTSRSPWLRRGLLLGAVVAALALAACGSSSSGSGSSGNAQSLLKQTFASGKPVKSGVLSISLTLNPVGLEHASTTPISFSISGPFQSRGTGQLPAVELHDQRSPRSAARASSGSCPPAPAGYVTLSGAAYQLPAADFQRLESGFSSVGGSGQGGGGLSTLGINPQHWLTNAVGRGLGHHRRHRHHAHPRRGQRRPPCSADINTFLDKASSTAGTKIPTSIPPATQQKIAAAIKNATVDVWTGKSDKVLRKLSLNLNVPVSGQALDRGRRPDLGRRSASPCQYSDVNQPQTITAPTNVKPYSEFTAKLRSVLRASRARWARAAGLDGSTGSSARRASSGSSAATAKIQKYSQCIQSAGQDVAKMQKCASMLNGS